MSRFGFENNPVKLPKLTTPVKRGGDRDRIADAAEAGRALGFVPREPDKAATRATRARKRKREERGNLLIHGPERVLALFRDYADGADLSYWQALEKLIEQKR